MRWELARNAATLLSDFTRARHAVSRGHLDTVTHTETHSHAHALAQRERERERERRCEQLSCLGLAYPVAQLLSVPEQSRVSDRDSAAD